MNITILDNIWASTDEPDVDNLLRYRVEGYQFAPSFKAGFWDGWIKLTRKKKGETLFPAGLVPYVLEQPWAQNAVVTDNRIQPDHEGTFSYAQLVSLIPEQEAAVELGVSEKRGIIQAPTGVGKSRIMGETIRRLNLPTLVICDKKDLMHQLAKELEAALGVKVGKIGDGIWEPRDCTVATYQTLARKLNPKSDENDNLTNQQRFEQDEVKDLLKFFDVVMVDETHHAESESVTEILKNCTNAYYRLAYSATPFKSFKGKATDKSTFLKVQAFLGPPISSLSIQEGVDTGRIVPAEIFYVTGCEPDNQVAPRNYKEEVVSNIVENEQRNMAIRLLAYSGLGQTIVLVERVEHGTKLAEAIGCAFIAGNTPSSTRKYLYNHFRAGTLNHLVIGKLGNEALDLPNIDTLILAGGGNAPHVTIQRVGRGMRASEGKERVTVFDFEDYGQYISKHSKRRKRTYEKEEAYTLVEIHRDELFDN